MLGTRKLSVFLCHASQDKPIVRELYQRLSAEGWIDAWLDEEKLSLGQHWTSTIEEAIDSADSVIIFLSRSSVQKEGYVQRELRHAWNRSLEKPQNVIFLIPFRLDDCEVPHNLRDRQWGDYFGSKKEKTYESLLDSLKQRHEQKLLLQRQEQARAEELVQIQKEEESRSAPEETRPGGFEESSHRETQRAQTDGILKVTPHEEAVRKNQVAQPQVRSRIIPSDFSGGGGRGILLEGGFVHYESLGRGRPVMFLHGWVGSWQYWFTSMQVISSIFHAYAMDLWGFGDSSSSPPNYSLEQQAALLERFLDEMGIGKVAIVGHGLGALVGMIFASRAPQRVDRLMAVSCPVDFESVNPRLSTAPPPELAAWLSGSSPNLHTVLTDVPKTDRRAIASSIASLQTNTIYRNFRLANIPCLLVYGKDDPAISRPSQSFHFSVMSRPIVLQNVGHFPMIEDPDRFIGLLTKFLALKSGTSPYELQLSIE
jgi:pimeloyl-ACP methyl ester carboxylesterase